MCQQVFAETMVRERQWSGIPPQQEELLDRGTPSDMHGLLPEVPSKLSEGSQIELSVLQAHLPQRPWHM